MEKDNITSRLQCFALQFLVCGSSYPATTLSQPASKSSKEERSLFTLQHLGVDGIEESTFNIYLLSPLIPRELLYVYNRDNL